jgi:hypothetical protein
MGWMTWIGDGSRMAARTFAVSRTKCRQLPQKHTTINEINPKGHGRNSARSPKLVNALLATWSISAGSVRGTDTPRRSTPRYFA